MQQQEAPTGGESLLLSVAVQVAEDASADPEEGQVGQGDRRRQRPAQPQVRPPTAEEQRRRMRALRERVGSHTVFDWASALLLAACRMEPVR